MPKRPVVDQERCIGCGHCADVCPKVFELVDDKSTVVWPDHECGTCGRRQDAVDTCPVQAISWEEESK